MQDQQNYDVIVCGGGPAGFGAALAAGRSGARTLLIERLGYLGGMHTSAGVSTWCDSPGGPLLEEYIHRLEQLNGVHHNYDPAVHVKPGRPTLNTELSKLVASSMLAEAGVTLLYLTFVHEAIVEDGQVKGVTVVNKTGMTHLYANVVIDATADADVAASAGTEFTIGDPEDGRIQHCNFRAWWDNIDRDRYEANLPSDDDLVELCVTAQREGRITPPENLFQPAADTFPFNRRVNRIQLTNWEFEKIDPLDAWQVSRTIAQCHRALMQLLPFCRQHLPGYENCELRKISDVLGVRESRRIVADYELTKDDVLKGSKFEDGVARGCFFTDLHDSPPGTTIPFDRSKIWEKRPPRDDWYEIPYRCMVPRGARGVIVAGRSISAERMAHGSARIMATCFYIGAAAGTAAAMCVDRSIDPHELDGKMLRKQLASTDESLA